MQKSRYNEWKLVSISRTSELDLWLEHIDNKKILIILLIPIQQLRLLRPNYIILSHQLMRYKPKNLISM